MIAITCAGRLPAGELIGVSESSTVISRPSLRRAGSSTPCASLHPPPAAGAGGRDPPVRVAELERRRHQRVHGERPRLGLGVAEQLCRRLDSRARYSRLRLSATMTASWIVQKSSPMPSSWICRAERFIAIEDRSIPRNGRTRFPTQKSGKTGPLPRRSPVAGTRVYALTQERMLAAAAL